VERIRSSLGGFALYSIPGAPYPTSMVNQVPVIGILMIVNGALCALYGVLLIFIGPFLSSIFEFQAGQMPPQAQPQMQQAQQMFQIVSVVYIVLGSVVALAGVMNIAGGISAIRYRSRGFVITALFFNILPLFTCYCLPTSLGLMIWGLIVMFQADVTHAFQLGASGYTADEIKRRMDRGDFRRDDDRRDEWREPGEPPRRPKEAERPPPVEGEPGDANIYGDKPPLPKPRPKSAPDQPPKGEKGQEGFFEK
jgi:hypothetical protein